MKAMFVGPLGKVTGSCTWLHDEANGWNLLVDCGLQQVEHTEKNWNAGNWTISVLSTGGADAANYDLTTTATGALTVSAKALTITVNDQTTPWPQAPNGKHEEFICRA